MQYGANGRPGWHSRAALLAALALSVCVVPLTAAAQGSEPNEKALLQAFAAFDSGYRDGRGRSEGTSSAVLGWAESGFLENYVRMYRLTDDVRWLEKVVDHVDRMAAHMTDPDGDGVPAWQTDRYSVSRMSAQALHNRGTAEVRPARDRVRNADRAQEAVDGRFAFERSAQDRYRLVRLPSREVLYDGPYSPGTPVPGLPGFQVRVEGTPEVGDTFLIETWAVEPLEYAVHEGMILYPVAQFIEIVTKDAGLRDRFGAAAQRYLDLIEDRILRKQERYWLQTGADEGAYRFTESPSERFPNRVLPHNQYLALGRAYLVLKDVSDNGLFGLRAEQMARRFRRHLQPDGEAFTWHYWDWVEAGEPGHSRAEDTSHGRIDIGFVVEAWRRGVVFDEADMVRLAKTFTERMWNGSLEAPRVGSHVDRKRGDAKVYDGWIELCRWDPRIWGLHWAMFRNDGERPVSAVPSILLTRRALEAQAR